MIHSLYRRLRLYEEHAGRSTGMVYMKLGYTALDRRSQSWSPARLVLICAAWPMSVLCTVVLQQASQRLPHENKMYLSPQFVYLYTCTRPTDVLVSCRGRAQRWLVDLKQNTFKIWLRFQKNTHYRVVYSRINIQAETKERMAWLHLVIVGSLDPCLDGISASDFVEIIILGIGEWAFREGRVKIHFTEWLAIHFYFRGPIFFRYPSL